MKIAIFSLLLCSAAGCSNVNKPVAQVSNAPANRAAERPQTAIAHGPESKDPPAAAAAGVQSKWTQSGDPIDTRAMDAEIAKAEKALSAKPADEAAKTALATAYMERAVALTGARQYASALGDYRRTLKYEPSNAEAKQWIEQINSIYSSMNRSSPAEGQEPPPLPFSKDRK